MLRTILKEMEPKLPPERPRRRRAGERIRRRAITLVPAEGTRVVWHPR